MTDPSGRNPAPHQRRHPAPGRRGDPPGDEDFRRIFGSTDEVYLEDLDERLQDDGAFWDRVYAEEVDRRQARRAAP